MYRNHRLELRLNHRDLEVLDRKRGPVSRSAWLRALIHQAPDRGFTSVTDVNFRDDRTDA